MGLTQKLGTIPLAISTDASNNVGIGTNAPLEQLNLMGANAYTSKIRFTNGASNTGYYTNFGYNSDGNKAYLQIADGGAASTIMTWNYNGNVGIGTTDPLREMVLYRASGEVHFKIANGTTGQGTTDGFDMAIDSSGGAYLINRENQPMYFLTNGTERMRIRYDGNIGIGNSGYSDGRVTIRGVDASSSNYAFTVQSGTPSNIIYVRNDGFLYSVSAWSGSDRRLKENITDLDNGLEKVLGLKARKFDFIGSFKNQFGFIAQEVQEIIPDAVNVYQEEDQMLAIKMDFIIHLVKAIQEQQIQIQNLQEQINAK